LQKCIIQLRDRRYEAALVFGQLNPLENSMVAESKDRNINTKAPIENDQVKRQPHERDETPDAQDQKPRGVIRQAAEDLAQGLVDTDARHGTDTGQATPPAPGATGQANPLPERAQDMRGRDASTSSRGKNR
jgi:hypothetical protein